MSVLYLLSMVSKLSKRCTVYVRVGSFRSLGCVLFVVHLPVLANVLPSPGRLSVQRGAQGRSVGFGHGMETLAKD